MRKVLLSALVVSTMTLGVPVAAASGPAHRARQDPQQTGSINGTAKSAKGEKLPNYKVRVRNATTGAIAAEALSDSAGVFSFAGLAPASYIVEIVNAAGEVVGLSSAIAVTAGAVATVTVTATAAGAIAAAAAGGGFSLLGLGTVASVAVVTAAGVATVAGVVAANSNASPSR